MTISIAMLMIGSIAFLPAIILEGTMFLMELVFVSRNPKETKIPFLLRLILLIMWIYAFCRMTKETISLFGNPFSL